MMHTEDFVKRGGREKHAASSTFDKFTREIWQPSTIRREANHQWRGLGEVPRVVPPGRRWHLICPRFSRAGQLQPRMCP